MKISRIKLRQRALGACIVLSLVIPTGTVLAVSDAEGLDTVALNFGVFLGVAGACNLPSAPIEAAMDRIMVLAQVAPSEIVRLKNKMMAARAVYGSGERQRRERHDPLDCNGAQEAINDALQKLP
jgi:hypothetical protein